MAWKIERDPWWQPYRPWHYELILSAYGACWGRSWTKRGASKALLIAQGRMLGGDW